MRSNTPPIVKSILGLIFGLVFISVWALFPSLFTLGICVVLLLLGFNSTPGRFKWFLLGVAATITMYEIHEKVYAFVVAGVGIMTAWIMDEKARDKIITDSQVEVIESEYQRNDAVKVL